MIKRIIAFSLAVIFSLLLAACGNSEQSKPDDTQSVSDAQDVGNVLFIYMCGSDLETKLGLAGKSIDELLSADVDGKLHIVIQTGGAKTWRSHDIRSDKLQRWEIKDGKLNLIQTEDDRSMGDQDTLKDFLIWGSSAYPSSRSSLVMWNHGGGCMKGVCVDENHVGDTLRLDEVKDALESAGLNHKFEIIGFDACLMSSIETAAAIKDYAQYMAASEENEPGGGWDYKAFAESLTNDTVQNTAQVICDSFMEKSKINGKESTATMSFLDLSKTDELLTEFNNLAKTLNKMLSQSGKDNIISAAEQSEQFGEKNSYLSSSNLVDLGDFVSHTVFYDRTRMDNILGQFVVCSVNSGRNNKGVSFYFPVKYDSREAENYAGMNVSEEYASFLTAFE